MNSHIFTSPLLPVQSSIWPITVSLALFSLMSNFVLFIGINSGFISLIVSFFLVVLVSFLWWNDFSRESFLGYHTHNLEVGLRSAMLLFIVSEVFFFLSFFWSFFDSSLSPVVELGITWPPNGIVPLSFYSVPLLNTVILLTSGVTVTWAHHSIINNYFNKSFTSLAFTVSLGVYFLFIQYLEYDEAHFSLADGVYGSTFFMATGFHGIHVIVGTTFLFYVLLILLTGTLSYSHHFSFEASAWYWHFVDVVWLFLFITIYWWGGLSH